jgi:hypothetical protein
VEGLNYRLLGATGIKFADISQFPNTKLYISKSPIKRNRSQGFTRAIVLLVTVIAVAGFGGWYVWHKSHAKTPTTSSNNTQQTPTTHKTAPPTADPSEGGKYLVIKEWGVRIPLAEELRGDVKYGVFTFSGGDQAIYFASKKLAAHSSGGACDLASENDSSGQGISGGTIAVSRSKTKSEVSDQRSFYQAAGYWYTVEPSNGGACYQVDTGQEKGAFNTRMHEAIKQLEPTN